MLIVTNRKGISHRKGMILSKESCDPRRSGRLGPLRGPVADIFRLSDTRSAERNYCLNTWGHLRRSQGAYESMHQTIHPAAQTTALAMLRSQRPMAMSRSDIQPHTAIHLIYLLNRLLEFPLATLSQRRTPTNHIVKT